MIACLWPVAFAHAAFPGANGKIAFDNGGDFAFGGGGIRVMNPDGTGITDLSPQDDLWPSWSPVGTQIAFQTHDPIESGCEWAGPCNWGVWKMTATGGGRTHLDGPYDEGFGAFQPAWSPDGQKIVFAADYPNGAGMRLYTINADGTGFTPLTSSGSDGDAEPAWSPDGSTVAFSADGELQLIDSDGNNRRTLASASFPFGKPDWSPDGGRIAFVDESGGSCDPGVVGPCTDVYVINADGSGLDNVTDIAEGDDPAYVSGPAWAPQGGRLVYARTASESPSGLAWELETINADGTDRRQLGVGGYNPDWQPIQTFALDPYPRPGGATPLTVPLVPAFTECTSPNSQHAPPLANPSCAPPARTSSLLTTSSIGVGSGRVRLNTVLGNPATPADEADFRITASATNVLNAGAGTAYTGTLLVRMLARITDKRSGYGAIPATVTDTPLSFPIACSSGSCNLNTTADTVVPGFIQERRRTIVAVRSLTVTDAGPDGSVSGSACPLTCGTGDERDYLEQGVFLP